MRDGLHTLIQSYALKGLVLIALSIMPTFAFCEPINLSEVKESLVEYYDSGEYEKEFASIIKEAFYYLQFRVNQNERLAKPKKLAMVLDIDETALSNYTDMKQLHFGGTTEEIRLLQMQAHDKVMKPTLALYNYALHHDVAIFFITARTKEEAAATKRNLAEAGYHDWSGLYFKPNHYHKKSVLDFKIADRKRIMQSGCEIILNLGDQYVDVRGGYADMNFKLPNPFYKTT